MRFTLTVTDDLGAAGTAAVTVVVLGDRPVADAGPDQVVIASARVILDGTGSRDDEGPIARYAWRQDAGIRVGRFPLAAPPGMSSSTIGRQDLAYQRPLR